MKRRPVAVLWLLCLGGCALPVPFQVASWTLDGLSYLATRKSIPDHGISHLAQRDCAMYRTLTEGQACRDEGAETASAGQGAGEGRPEDCPLAEIAAAPSEDIYYLLATFPSEHVARDVLDDCASLDRARVFVRIRGDDEGRLMFGPVSPSDRAAVLWAFDLVGYRQAEAFTLEVTPGDEPS